MAEVSPARGREERLASPTRKYGARDRKAAMARRKAPHLRKGVKPGAMAALIGAPSPLVIEGERKETTAYPAPPRIGAAERWLNLIPSPSAEG